MARQWLDAKARAARRRTMALLAKADAATRAGYYRAVMRNMFGAVDHLDDETNAYAPVVLRLPIGVLKRLAADTEDTAQRPAILLWLHRQLLRWRADEHRRRLQRDIDRTFTEDEKEKDPYDAGIL